VRCRGARRASRVLHRLGEGVSGRGKEDVWGKEVQTKGEGGVSGESC
jgi:hypothetical protein